MSSSERLPSFKGPRDLSLSTRGVKRDGTASGQGSAQARPRRVFTPNIPPKRDRGTATPASGDTSSASLARPKENLNAAGSSRGRGARGRGGPRGGARPGKQRGELLQSESIFSDGVGDPMDAKRNSAMQYKSGYGSSRYKSATEGGPSRMSSMNRTTLNTLIKEEDDESNRKIFGSEKFEREEIDEAGSENPNTPIVLPLVGYVSELFMEPAPLLLEGSTAVASAQDYPIPGTSKDSESGIMSVLKIKEEKIDEDDVPTIMKIKKEKPDDTEKEVDSGMVALAAMSLDPTTFAGTFRTTPPDGTLVYFQFPDELPVLQGSVGESVDQQDTNKNSADLVQDINDLPEGFVGRLQIISNGKTTRTRFVIGENTFDVDSGRPVGFRQDLYSVDIENTKLTNLGPINRKFVITPDIESLIRDAL